MMRTIGRMRRSYFAEFAMLVAMALLCVLANTSAAAAGDTTRVSVDSSGAQANGTSVLTTMSSDGRFVLIRSAATNLVAGDTNRRTDPFVHDRQTGITERVNIVSRFGTQPNGGTDIQSMSDDSRYLAFQSFANNLVADDTNGTLDIFVHDRQTGITERVSVNSSGAQANLGSGGPTISSDGRFVAFTSGASNLVSGDTNGISDIFVRDRDTDEDGIFDEAGDVSTKRVSVDSSGTEANGSSGFGLPTISSDGRFVAFTSNASNLVADDTNSTLDIFVRDRDTDEDGIFDEAGDVSTKRVSVDSSGTEANNGSSDMFISPDGRFVTFTSAASNLVSGDTNGISDIFVHDRQTGITERVNVNGCPNEANADSWSPRISSGGRFVVFTSAASNLVSGDTNRFPDVFLRDRQTGTIQRVNVANSSGDQANADTIDASLSSDGTYVAFTSAASNLVTGDTNGLLDVFVHERRSEPDSSADDCVAPTTTATAISSSGAPYEPGTWTTQDVRVTLTAQDNEGGSGVGTKYLDSFDEEGNAITVEREDIRYSASGAQSIDETFYDPQGPPLIYTEGTTTISYFATDNMGNHESPKTLTVKIDRTAPTANMSINSGDEFTNSTAVNLTLSDEPAPGSGVAEMRFSSDSANWSEWEPFATTKEWAVSEGEGEKSVYVQLKDAAGNLSDTGQDSIILDKTAPAVSSTSPSNYATGVLATDNISATFTESGSGIDLGTFSSSTFQVMQLKPAGNVPVSSGTFSLNEDSQGSQVVTFDPSSSLAKGAYRVTITGVKDKAGNSFANAYTWTFATAGPSKR